MAEAATERLKRLDSISDLGLYKDFSWDSDLLSDFNRYNLIYGHNYSGKTTLSRVFQSIENRGIHPDFAGATFSFTKGNGDTVSSSFDEPLPQVRVFNKEFVLRNFHEGGDMTGAGLIAVIGETNHALKTKKETLNKRAQMVLNFKSQLAVKKDRIESRLNAEATAQARTINQVVGGPYTRTHLLNHTIPSLPNDYLPLPLSESDLEAEKEQFRRAGDFESIDLYKPDHSIFFETLFKLRSSLKELASNTAIECLRENTNLERWVESGLVYHEAGKKCGFCGELVSEQRWTALKGHFSEAFSNLQNKLNAYKSDLSDLTFEAPIINETALYPELRDQYKGALEEVMSCLQPASDYMQEVIGYIDRKLQNIESAVNWIPNTTAAKDLRGAIRNLNKVLEQHNVKVRGADSVRRASKSKITKHFAVDYLKRNNVLQAEENTSEVAPNLGQVAVMV